jgi:hypothetical protein
MAAQRPDLPLSGEHSIRGGYVSVTRCRRCGIVIGFGERCEFCQSRPSDHVDSPGEYLGRHHTEWITTVDELLIQGDDDDAEFLLWKLVDASEAESLVAGVPPLERHFTRLAQLAKRRSDSRLAAVVQARYDACVRQTESDHRAAG